MTRVVFLILVACAGSGKAAPRGTSGGADPTDTKPDNKPTPVPPSDKVCDPFEPRIPAPELFIGPDGIEAKLVELMGTAEHTLDILIYELGTEPILNAIIAAKQRGVTVRMVIDRDHNKSAKEKLTAAGVDWKPSPDVFPYAHTKAMLIDGVTSVIMSANMNSYSMRSERNYGIISHDAGDAEDVAKIFEADYADKPDSVKLPCTRLLVAPINARTRLQEMIDSASATLDLSVMYISDDKFYDGIVARKKAGVNVRVLLADPEWMTYNDELAADLQAQGIPARYMTKLELHAKLMISDDRAYVGSENFSANSVDKNREIGAIVSNTEQVRAIRAQFEQDWAEGVTP